MSDHPLEKYMLPDEEGFENDPFGYSSLAWHKWCIAQTVAGHDIEIIKSPSSADLKSPILWLTQANALSKAATSLLDNKPNLEALPEYTQGVVHCQYHSVALMLVGLSLEVSLKAILILNQGVDSFTEIEKSHRHHRLLELCKVVPGLSEKDGAILECLTHFIYWSGKYPDPGSGRHDDKEHIFELSEKYQINAKQLFELTTRILNYVSEEVHNATSEN